jgi:formate hydrogenlyase subunit 3/multisubunit Na+/H+ antiporter MnhD subunit
LEVWSAPFASLNLGLDSLTALLLVPGLLAGGVASLRAIRPRPGEFAANHHREYWLYSNILLAAFVLALAARNAVLFLLAGEVVFLAAFLLLLGGGGRKNYPLSWRQLKIWQLACLIQFSAFAILGREAEVANFSLLHPGALATPVFFLALAAFLAATGLFPFPSGASGRQDAPWTFNAVWPGVLGGLPLYGLLRTLDILGNGVPPPFFWGAGLVGVGLVSIFRALWQRSRADDLARHIVHATAEGWGLVAVALGLGLLDLASDRPASFPTLHFVAAYLAYAGVVTGGGGLFLLAGGLHSLGGSRRLDNLGGLGVSRPGGECLAVLAGLGTPCLPTLPGFAALVLLFATLPEGNPVLVLSVLAVGLGALVSFALSLTRHRRIFRGKPGATLPHPEVVALPGEVLPPLLLILAAPALAVSLPWSAPVIQSALAGLVRLWRGERGIRGVLPSEVSGNLYPVLAGVTAATTLLIVFWMLGRLLRKPASFPKRKGKLRHSGGKPPRKGNK